MTNAPGLMTAALTHAERGWCVFPLRPGDKRPALRADWERRATAADKARIRRCWEHAAYNVGIACGPSGLIVVDLDVPKAGERPPAEWAREPGIWDGADVFATLCERHGQPFPFDTYTVLTGRGGMHLYFTEPAGLELRNSAGRLGWLIDTRARGGYVVAAGSIVAGRVYTVVNDADPAPLPGWLAALLTASSRPAYGAVRMPEIPQDHAAGYAGSALRGEVQRVLDATPGNRNHTLNQAAFALGQLAAAGMLPEPLVFDCLFAAGQHIGLSARECEATIRSGLMSGARRPRMGAA
ncbi:Bifunctional DNA primase/polymerase, N-terminal [Thermomonospora echinospora]|uniref:Bifunctional DNA primase/polymerase, N-terminal n=1 Tax=Thermomonospora echinospora TaxID=1992 RepID=A0A1H6E0P3_9ACTN|nr:bifunctional DNA primase/polymerase [Thermomonospora echinospora]SEG90991.1 Bifunctional DNA primase/polymerase, N-terminal [Thermomonospora echinospora]